MTPIASILIVSYNNFETTTMLCLDALLNDPDRETFQIMVIDNGSDEETIHHLTQVKQNYPEIDLIYNKENRGFAAANNQLLKRAQGEVLILLNSDTIPPPGSLSHLVKLLKQQPELEMISPVTNASGNEQHIEINSENPTIILNKGEEWCWHAQNSWIPTQRLEFSCMAMTRAAYESIGLLDEEFGKGYYEDTDYCQRAMDLNIPMHVVEEVFIYHRGSGSFKTIPDSVHQLMKRNKALFFHKHPNTAKMKSRRQCNLDALWHYVSQISRISQIYQQQQENKNNLKWRFAYRLQQAKRERPNNPVKNLLYRWKLLRLKKAFEQARE